MSRVVQDITFRVTGQRLTFDAPEGRPSSVVSVEVWPWDFADTDDAEVATSGSASVEVNPNTTTNGAAGTSQDDPRVIPVVATTGIAKERVLLLVGLNGAREWIDVETFEDDVSVTALQPLHNDYASGAALLSTRISIALDDDWIADLQNLDDVAGANPSYRVRWVYLVDGVTHVADTYFNLVRYPAQHGVRPQDVELVRAGWLNSLPTDHRADQGVRLIQGGFKGVRANLHEVLVDDASIADSEVFDELVIYKTVALTEWSRYLDSPDLGPERFQSADKKYSEQLAAFVRVTTKVPQRDSSGAAAIVPAMPMTRR